MMHGTDNRTGKKTAFVFAGGGSFGAIQVGMMQALAAHGLQADLVVGSSVGAINGAYYAGAPTLHGVQRLADIWRGLRRQDVFPVTLRTFLGFLWRRDFLITHDGVRQLVLDHLPYRKLEDARIPVHIVTTNIVTGDAVVLSDGSAVDAIVASTAIPGAFAPVPYNGLFLADGAIASNTPIKVALEKGAERLIVLPTGFACAEQAPQGRRRQCVARDHAPDRPADGRRSRGVARHDRLLRRTAAVSAGWISLRLLT